MARPQGARRTGGTRATENAARRRRDRANAKRLWTQDTRHQLNLRVSAVRMSPASAIRTTTPYTARATAAAAKASPALASGPGEPKAPTHQPAAPASTPPTTPAPSARDRPCSALEPAVVRTDRNSRSPAMVMPTALPIPRASTVSLAGSRTTRMMSAMATTAHPDTIATAARRPRPSAYMTLLRWATRPYPIRPGAQPRSARESSAGSSAPGTAGACSRKTLDAGTAAAARMAAPRQLASTTARDVAATPWANPGPSPVSCRADRWGKALVAIGTVSTAYGRRYSAQAYP